MNQLKLGEIKYSNKLDQYSKEELISKYASLEGAETAAILFSIVETCKLNGVNPREYFPALIKDLLDGKKPYTPAEFKLKS